jgi:hypothetical protein
VKRHPIRILVTLLLLAYPAYMLITAAMIRYCIYDLTQTHGCTYIFFNSGDETRFVKKMGDRSIGPLIHTIDHTNVSLSARIHLTWILSSIGDHSRFSVFIDGLNSTFENPPYIAAERMKDFPAECLRHAPEILKAGTYKQNYSYWSVIWRMVEAASLDKNSKHKTEEIIMSHMVGNGMLLTGADVTNLLARMKVVARN